MGQFVPILAVKVTEFFHQSELALHTDAGMFRYGASDEVAHRTVRFRFLFQQCGFFRGQPQMELLGSLACHTFILKDGLSVHSSAGRNSGFAAPVRSTRQVTFVYTRVQLAWHTLQRSTIYSRTVFPPKVPHENALRRNAQHYSTVKKTPKYTMMGYASRMP